MIDAHVFVLFLAAATLLAITPGPGIFYVLSRSLTGGSAEGFLSAAGTFIGGPSTWWQPQLDYPQSLRPQPWHLHSSSMPVRPI
jgi:hypothetical protein